MIGFGRPLTSRAVRPIEVELVTQMEFEDAFEVPPETTVTPLVAPIVTEEPEAEPPAPADGMTEATQLFANRVLADPQNSQVRETLPLLDHTDASSSCAPSRALNNCASRSPVRFRTLSHRRRSAQPLCWA